MRVVPKRSHQLNQNREPAPATARKAMASRPAWILRLEVIGALYSLQVIDHVYVVHQSGCHNEQGEGQRQAVPLAIRKPDSRCDHGP